MVVKFFKDLKKNSGKFLVTQGSFFDSKSGNPAMALIKNWINSKKLSWLFF